MKFGAWTEDGPESVIEKAQVRLRQEGWDGIRPALATTIRSVPFDISLRCCILLTCYHSCWIMRGFIEGGLRGKHGLTVEFLSRAIEVLNWGRIAWKNVSRDDRGAIFEDTFVRGVRAMHMNAFMEVCFSSRILLSVR
jgi:hypothetical protein